MSTPPAALDVLLSLTATEISHCRKLVQRLEDAIHALVDRGEIQMTSGPARELQAIDRLDQRLHDLTRWTEALALATRDCPIAMSAADLAPVLSLAELRHALTGAETAPAFPPSAAEVF
ncbi:hypothetical protein Q9295_11640 [Xinfangfangia sp. CPCC 101601]|uniref:Uncharacterized protein n=1 Tax=Pseudogemmobacter lacusdianii TaxID=3069608 RepID=A0ABU0VZ46_9RHOB|nr:hypothetical protein [Xinfangfangia sp. CPCC 101601]MDQ2067031.1 hypothetical protein [Xinfangfangia sp. CPCC 101601]